MTVRVFDYADFTAGSRLGLDEGTLDSFRSGGLLFGAFTLVAVFKRSAATTESVQYVLSLNANTSVRAAIALAGQQPSTQLQFDMGGGTVTFAAPVADNTWYVAAIRFPGTAGSTPQARLWDLDNETDSGWLDASGTRDPDNNPLTSIELGNRPSDFPLNGKIAAAGAYAVSIGTDGDDLDLAPADWPTTDLVALWVLDQASTATAVTDLVGDADQTSITGTSVDGADDPPYRAAGGGQTDLAAASASHAHAADQPTVTQVHVLGVDSATHAHAATAPTLTQAHALAVDVAAHGHTATAAAVTQTHALTTADTVHDHAATTPTLTVAGDLAVDDATHSHAAASPALTQVHELDTADAAHGHSAGQPALQAGSTLAADNAAHAHAAGTPAVTQTHVLAVEPATHAHLAGVAALTQLHLLDPDDATHAHTATSPPAGEPGATARGTVRLRSISTVRTPNRAVVTLR